MKEKSRFLLEEAPVGRALGQMSMHSILGIMAYNLYNIFDTIFISQGAGAAAVGGVSVSFPLFLFLSAVSSTLGNGAASVISRALGRKDQETAQRAAANTFVLFYLTAVLVTFSGLVFLRPLLRGMGITETLLPCAEDYTRIILLGAVTSTGFSSLIRAEGNSRYAMLLWVIPMLANIGLDIWFIFGLNMGVTGAAVGTVLAQTISMMMSMYYFFLSGKSVLRIRLRHFKPDLKLLGEIVWIGFSSFLQMSGTGISIVVVNRFLKKYGDLPISAYGIANKIHTFFLVPVMGLVQGLQPVIGYNQGAGKQKRVRKALRKASAAAGIYGAASCLMAVCCSGILMRVFTSERKVAELGGHILMIVSFALLFQGLQSVQAAYFQAVGRKRVSMLLTLWSQVLCFAPVMFWMGELYGIEGIWYAFPLSAGISLLVSTGFLIWTIRNEKNIITI